ncbi:hypothetical protein P3T27_006591 [Kitasatospora sp. MAA19]|uniref:hypothetical protein n=1 Tax=Kitasatospora sp. MAA19 TaxID=3035090 RepID=UPI00247477D9|nr:hypothetical protein [Kitasatospora sp. MAA19]MDH6709842.1 hypothetical protein [Kitasatospora sp. MAA19]
MPTLHSTATAAARTPRCLERRRAGSAKLGWVRRALDPRHPGLRTHRHHALPGHSGQRVWDSYVETGADAWRIYWIWGPTDGGRQERKGQEDPVVTVLLIGPHL